MVCDWLYMLGRERVNEVKEDVEHIVRRMAKNVYFNGVSMMVRFLSAIIQSIIVARFLGPTHFGSYILVTFIFVVAGILTNLGLTSVGTKYTAEYSGPENKELRSKILGYILKIKVIMVVVVTAVLLVNAHCLATFFADAQLKIYIVILALTLIPSEIAVAFESVIRGMQEYKYLAYRTLLIAPLKIVLSFVLLKMGYGIIALLWLTLFVSFCELSIFFSFLKIKLGFSFNLRNPLPEEIRQKILKYNWQVAIIVIFDTIVWERSEVFFLGKYHPGAQVAFYGLAYTIAEGAMIFFPMIFSGVLMPVFSESYGRKDRQMVQKIYKNSLRYLALFSIPVCIIIMMFSRMVIGLLYGSHYLPAALILDILLISGCLRVISSSSSSVQYGTENQSFILKLGSVLAVFNIVLDFILIPKFGAIGAALANSITQVLGVFFGIANACRITSVRFPLKDFSKILLAASAMIPLIILAQKILPGLMSLGVIPVAIALYLLTLWNVKIFMKNDLEIIRIVVERMPKSLQFLSGRLLHFIEKYAKFNTEYRTKK